MLMRCALLALGAVAQAAAAPTEASVLCTPTAGSFKCTLGSATAKEWTAKARLSNDMNTTGWGSLTVESNAAANSDEVQAFAAGYVEGALTTELIDLTWQNSVSQTNISSKTLDYVLANEKWVRNQCAAAKKDDPYWTSVALTLAQLDGMVAGYAEHRGGLNALTATQIMLLGMMVELDDFAYAADKAARPDYSRMTNRELEEYVFEHSHCSAIFKVNADLTEVFASHNTWTYYMAMLRLFKTYTFPFQTKGVSKAKSVMFSGYPASIAGIDDFYLTDQQLVVIETTNNVFNTSLYDAVTTESVPYWIRVAVATRAATTAAGWHEVFYRYNSGTYNNQWLTLDFKQFTSGQPLKPGLFYVSEQIPGYHTGADQTMVLQRGHWPSYNVPFYEEVYKRSGYPEAVKQAGVTESYQLAPRAPIFRKYADAPQDLDGVRHFMRLNRWNITDARGELDPLFPTPMSAIAARGDLAGRYGGAIDAKIVTSKMAADMTVTAVSGPTNDGVSGDDQPVFEWTGYLNNGSYPHFGQPKKFDFPWVNFTATKLA